MTARDKMLQAVGSIIENLRGIAGNIMELSQSSQELSRDHTEEEHSFFKKMAGYLTEVSLGLEQYGLASHDLSRLLHSVAPTIGEMSLCLRDIEGIEIAIERIALNACIKAAHLGEEGAALGVLAEGIQHLLGDTRQQTLAASKKLESIIAAAQELGASDIDDVGDSNTDISLWTNEIKTITESLRILNNHGNYASPGFFTASEVTNVSGRGVGMDVVKKAIEALGGSIESHSQQGVGTTFTIKLPLTLAIIEGLLVSIKDDYFVVPLAAVTECVELTREDVSRSHGHKVTRVRDKIVPYVHLREAFEIEGQHPAIEQIVITSGSGCTHHL